MCSWMCVPLLCRVTVLESPLVCDEIILKVYREKVECYLEVLETSLCERKVSLGRESRRQQLAVTVNVLYRLVQW